MRIIVSKIGAVLRTRDYGSTEKGEQGDTESIVRHLVSLGHEVVYFGIVKGTLPCAVVEPDLQGLDLYSSAALQKEQFARNYAAVMAAFTAPPQLYLSVCGQTSGWVTIDNPAFSSVLAMAMRYIGPQLSMAHELASRHQCPRALVNFDLRAYPREQEHTITWPDILPIAILDAHTTDKKQKISGVPLKRRTVDARIASWTEFERNAPLDSMSRRPVIIVAHAHIKDGLLRPDRDSRWRHILEGCPPDTLVYGAGWTHFSGFSNARVCFEGVLPSNAVVPTMCNAMTSPYLGYEPNYMTQKAYLAIHCGAIPLLWGRGDDYLTADPQARLVPLDHPTRVSWGDNTSHAIAYVKDNYSELRDQFREWFKPDWSVLDQMLDRVDSGEDTGTEKWWHDFGGYKR